MIKATLEVAVTAQQLARFTRFVLYVLLALLN